MASKLSVAQLNGAAKGTLQVNTFTVSGHVPIDNATVRISYTGNPEETIEELKTDANGQTEDVELPAPPVELSLDRTNIQQPYSEYNIQIIAEGFDTVVISGAQILADTNATQEIRLLPREVTEGVVFAIPPHTLYGDFPPKIAEDEIKPVGEPGEIVLSRVVVPEFIVVHDGVPTDSTAQNHYVEFKDYIKNVASSEIYPTWPEATIYANILAILSFTLNRVYTEWYRNQGFNFTITSSTAFDHKWMNGRNYYDSISLTVDQIFTNYLSRPNVKQPILTQYCDGQRTTCPNWMTQWGSKDLGDQGYTAIEIIRYYYGEDMYINTAEQVSGVPASWPGSNLGIGASGDNVRQIQEQLNAVANVYTAIPRIAVDGVFGENTGNAVRQFQSVFGLPATGIVDYRTWYKISEIFVAVTRIAELF
ncbi:MAG: peptidoglycan-binding protein [Clostridiales bacterium]|nr:peptidoglycan-binding protein [Clostridiales bacterium]